MHDLEDHYWWFVGRRNVALKLLRKFGGAQPRVLDLGCGTGVISGELTQWAEPISLDMSELALAFSKDRGIPTLVQARGEWLPLKTGSVDAVLALDVFEHVKDDGAALKEAFRVLRPGGVLVLSVPAFKGLWGPHDVALMHFRRYTRGQMRARLQEAGFQIPRLSYSVFFLFPIVVLIRILEKAKRGEAHASLPKVPEWFNRALIGLQNIEASIIGSVSLPWGSSVLAVAQKPK
jgi:SAM-dependent methyltransferase